ncbi:MAG: hypothetical protein LBK95_14710 [Bifidobacteriaceae bacterium]|nr:hypothetical protein [Bifidobacteriaceae bacterium]
MLSYPGGSVWFESWFSYSDSAGYYRFAEVRFSDGTVWAPQDVTGLLTM